MFRKKDINKIEENIDKIKDNVILHYKENYEPTLNEITDVFNTILEFIKDNKLIIYGGYAQNKLLQYKNKDDFIYKKINGLYFNWPDLADIEFYSNEPIKHLIELTNLLNTKFKYVEGREGIHEGSYKIFVNFINYCDISYMPTNIYNKIPNIEIEGILYTHPYFMVIDYYRIINDPMTSYWRLDKTLKRFDKLMNYYPIEYNKNENIEKIEKNDFKKELKFILHHIIKKSKLIVIGDYAYNYYISKISKKEKIDIKYYEVISSNYEEDIKNIYKILKNKLGNITTKEFYPFYEFYDNRIEFYYNNTLILKVYNRYNRCVIYKYSDKKKIHYGTISLVLMFYLINYMYLLVNNNLNNKYLEKYNNLINTRDKYLEKKDISVLDESPFQYFTYKCYGEPKDPIRSSFLEIQEKKKQGKRLKFIYVPRDNKKDININYIFSNISGNEILNEKYLVLKKNI
jgi:hypothetical protein